MIVIIATVIFIVGCSSHKKLIKDNVKFYGKVKSVVVKTYTFSDETKEKRFFSHYKHFFDKQGKLIETDKFKTKDGSLYQKKTYKYDKNGHQTTEFYAPTRKEFPLYHYSYDTNGNFKEIHFCKPNGDLDQKVVCTYDVKGNLIQTDVYKPNGTLLNKNVQKYDKRNHVVEDISSRYNSDGSLDVKITCKYGYDRYGNETMSSRYATSGKMEYKSTSRFDKKGNKKEYIVYTDEKSISYREIYEYDQKGNVKQEKKYNSNGDLTYTISYKYEFDSKGNWIQRTRYYNNDINGITQRSYEYFE